MLKVKHMFNGNAKMQLLRRCQKTKLPCVELTKTVFHYCFFFFHICIQQRAACNNILRSIFTIK